MEQLLKDIPQDIRDDMKKLSEENRRELQERILPFWMGLRDDTYGGYVGYVDDQLNVNRSSEKGGILNSRILYFFSEAYLLLKEDALLDEAKHAYQFLIEHFVDQKQGGIYWSVDYQGNPLDTTKHTYCQAFAIYGLSSYYRATGDSEALELAWKLYQLIEKKMRDDGGYLEAYHVDFTPASNEKLSENGVSATRTMNTILHVLEGYTQLYRIARDGACVHRDEILKSVGGSLKEILTIVLDKIYNPSLKRQEVFFDHEYHSLIDLYSYGHDIEAAWLLDLAADTLGDTRLNQRIHEMSKAMEENVYRVAYDGHSLPAEAENGIVLEDRVWWVQAETVNGFLHAYMKRPAERAYYDAARSTFDYIEEKMVDPRTGSEWYWKLDREGKPVPGFPIAEPWKCPYHNGRMCFETIRSIEQAL